MKNPDFWLFLKIGGSGHVPKVTLGHVPKVAVADCGISICQSAQYMALVTHLYFLPGPVPCSGKLLGKTAFAWSPWWGLLHSGRKPVPSREEKDIFRGWQIQEAGRVHLGTLEVRLSST